MKAVSRATLAGMFPLALSAGKASYALPSKAWIENELFPWYRKAMDAFGLTYQHDFQCTGFALLFRAAAVIAYARGDHQAPDPEQIAIAEFWFLPTASPTRHAIDIALCDDAVQRFVEPQGPAWVELTEDEIASAHVVRLE
jgi:hypothetical protein